MRGKDFAKDQKYGALNEDQTHYLVVIGVQE